MEADSAFTKVTLSSERMQLQVTIPLQTRQVQNLYLMQRMASSGANSQRAALLPDQEEALWFCSRKATGKKAREL